MMQQVINRASPPLNAVQRLTKLQEREAPHLHVAAPLPNPPPSQTQLPLWPETVRCLPNEIVRSALFTARNHKQPRIKFDDAEIAVIGVGSIIYSGQELRQEDETVWLQLIHMAKERPFGQPVEFTSYSFCKAIGWHINGRNNERLRECLKRLQQTSLAISSKRLKADVSLSMIPAFKCKNSDTGRAVRLYQVEIPQQLVKLFGNMHYTGLEWSQRLILPDGLAMWLHGYFASHKKPHPIKLETIKQGAGLTVHQFKHLREMVIEALEALKEVGFLADYWFEGDLVHVIRTCRRKYTPNQTRKFSGGRWRYERH